jgi:mono/diheme cytochrome c family protein
MGFTLGVVLIGAMVSGSGFLLIAAMKDQVPPQMAQLVEERMTDTEKKESENAKTFHMELATAEASADRALVLAGEGIPAEGAISLLRHDPLSQGKPLFRQSCAGCHNHGDDSKSDSATASDLEGFATEKWIRDLLRDPNSPRFFGHTKLKTMSNWVERTRKKAVNTNKVDALDSDFDVIAYFLATHPRRVPAAGEDPRALEGYKAFEKHCMECHTFAGNGGGSTPAPDFTGYGDADWLRLMLMAPYHPLRYGGRNLMPSFRDLEGPTARVTRQELEDVKQVFLKEVGDDAQAEAKRKAVEQAIKPAHLSDVDRELILRWLRKDYRLIYGGEPIATKEP